MRPGLVDANVGQQRAERRAKTRMRWDQGRLRPNDSGNRRRMQRPRAAERHQAEHAGIQSTLHGQQPHGLGNVLDRDLHHGVCRFDRWEADFSGRALNRHVSKVRVQWQIAAQKIIRVQPAQDHVGVRNGGLLAALRIASRPRNRAGALRSDLQQATLVHPCNGTAAGPHRRHLDKRCGHRQPELDFPGRRISNPVVGDHAHVGAGPTHVERNHVRRAGLRAKGLPGNDPPGQARQDRLHRPLARRLRQHLAAVRLHH